MQQPDQSPHTSSEQDGSLSHVRKFVLVLFLMAAFFWCFIDLLVSSVDFGNLEALSSISDVLLFGSGREKKEAIVLVFDSSMETCACHLVETIRTTGSWNGSILAIVPIPYNPNASVFNDVQFVHVPDFSNLTYHGSRKPYNKFYLVTHPQFREYTALLYLDVDGTVEDGIEPLFEALSESDSTLLMRDNGVGIGKGTLDQEFASRLPERLAIPNTMNPGATCFFLLAMQRLPAPKIMETLIMDVIEEYGPYILYADQSIFHVVFRHEYNVMAPCLPIEIVHSEQNSSQGWMNTHCSGKAHIYRHDYLKTCLKKTDSCQLPH